MKLETESNTKTGKYTIKSVETAMTILDHLLIRGKGTSVTTVSTALHINTNMAHRLLQTMTASGYLEQDPETSRYNPSLKTLQLGRVALNSLEIRKRSFPYMEALWRDARAANVNLSMRQNNEIMVIDRIDSGGIPRTYSTPGKILPAHASSMGKILMCELPESEVAAIVGTGELTRLTKTTITTFDALIQELEKVRAEQLAWDVHEQIPNSCCVAAPVRNEQGEIIAAISLSAFEIFMSRKKMEEAIPRLQIAASHISFAMGFNNS